MDDDTLIQVAGLSKKFCSNLRRGMYYGLVDISRSMLRRGRAPEQLRRDEFWALQDIGFSLRRGETLGVIGRNGSGKTTLLRMINGIFPPDRGRIAVRGRIGALIAVGVGFHPHMTGRENIYLNGSILGMARREIDRKFDDIVDFADLGRFVDAPVSTYSSGMKVRLGFAIAINTEIDILLVDEVLAVGDIGFQLKCFNKIGELRKNGVGTLLVSHDLHAITTFSTAVLLLTDGRLEYAGEVKTGVSRYKKQFARSFEAAGEIEKVATGADGFRILDVAFDPPLEKDFITLNTHESLSLRLVYEAAHDFEDVELDMTIYVPIPGPHFYQATNRTYRRHMRLTKGSGRISATIRNISLNNISAHFAVALWTQGRHDKLFWWRRIPLYIAGNPLSTGWSHFEAEFSVDPPA